MGILSGFDVFVEEGDEAVVFRNGRAQEVPGNLGVQQLLRAAGLRGASPEAFGGSGIPILALAYIFATLVRIAQGSATVAMLTAAGLMSGFVGDLSQPMLALVTCAIASGAIGYSHVNDSGFWMISRYMGMTEKQTLKTWTILSTAISLVSFAIIVLLGIFIK